MSRDNDTSMNDFWKQMGWETHGNWEDAEVRKAAVRFLVDKVLQKDPRDVTVSDFQKNRLKTMLREYFHNSPYGALKEAGYQIEAWERARVPRGFYDIQENRVRAVRSLVERTGKSPTDMTQGDFRANGFHTLLDDYYHGSAFNALVDAGYGVEGWQMGRAPKGFYKDEINRRIATRWLVTISGKDPRDIKVRDFLDHNLEGLLRAYGGSPYRAISDAGYEIEPWKMRETPHGFYRDRRNRIRAAKWLLRQTGKDPRDVMIEDFDDSGLSGLIELYGDSPYRLFLDFGLVNASDMAYMKHSKQSELRRVNAM